jgi:tRNA(Met) C34 N-acetyltransferase TmcA
MSRGWPGHEDGCCCEACEHILDPPTQRKAEMPKEVRQARCERLEKQLQPSTSPTQGNAIEGLVAGLLDPEYGIADMPLIREAATALGRQADDIFILKKNLTLAQERITRLTGALEQAGWVVVSADEIEPLRTLRKQEDNLAAIVKATREATNPSASEE